MKKLIFICFLGLTSFTYSQTFLFKDGIELSEIEVYSNKVNVVNEKYFEESSKYLTSVFGEIPKSIRKTQLMIAKIDLDDLKKDCSTCTKFKATIEGSEHSRAVVLFDEKGEVIKSFEYYKNLFPPLSVKHKLQYSYPNWSLLKSSYTYSYQRSVERPESSYFINIEDEEGSIKRLKFNSLNIMLENEVGYLKNVTKNSRNVDF